jgi:hypothetical protein
MGQDTKFTPGPWKAVALGGASTVLAPTMPPRNDTRTQVAYGYQIDGEYCLAYPVLNENEYGDCEQTRRDYVHFSHADAHLISAAPEMYEALGAVLANHAYFAPAGNKNCRFCDNDLDHEGTFRDMHAPDCVVHIIRAARAKAKGE